MKVYAVWSMWYDYGGKIDSTHLEGIWANEANAYLWGSLYKETLEIENMGAKVECHIRELEINGPLTARSP